MQPKIIAMIVGAVVVVGGGVWAFTGGEAEPTGPIVPEELTVEAIKEQVKEDPMKVMDRMRDAQRDENLTEEQKRRIRRNGRAVMMEEMDKRMDEYFAATDEAEKNAILDRQIDEFQKMREVWRKRREEREAEREAKGEDAEGDRGGPPWRRGPQTREQRQNRSEGRSPDAMAKRMTYFMAMRARAQARGIEMGGPGGRGGRRGGGGRGGR